MTYYVSGSALSASGHNGSFLDTTGGATGTAISYDALGNATAVGSSSYTYNAQNQISGSGAPTYDNNGNTTLAAGSTYVYDGWNRLVGINSGTEAFVYDAQGRRIYEAQDGEGRYYDSAGQVIQETGAAAQYVWGLGYANDMVLRDDGYFGGGSLGKTSSGLGERLYVEQDADWDVTSLSDNSGNIVQHIIYNDPFGNNVTGVTGDWSSYEGFYSTPYLFAFGFQGGRYDATGLWQFGVREYDPSIAAGRWMQEEPFGSDYIDGMNLYQFELGNPVSHRDPTGLCTNFSRDVTWPDDNKPKIALTETNVHNPDEVDKAIEDAKGVMTAIKVFGALLGGAGEEGPAGAVGAGVDIGLEVFGPEGSPTAVAGLPQAIGAAAVETRIMWVRLAITTCHCGKPVTMERWIPLVIYPELSDPTNQESVQGAGPAEIHDAMQRLRNRLMAGHDPLD